MDPNNHGPRNADLVWMAKFRTVDSYVGLSKRCIKRQAARLRNEVVKKFCNYKKLTKLPFCQSCLLNYFSVGRVTGRRQ